MGIQPMVFCALLGCLISLLIIPLMLLPGLMRSVLACRASKGVSNFPAASLHDRSVCGVGGIALATAFLGVATLVYFLYPEAWTSAGHSNVAIIWTALAIFFLGLWDDFRPLKANWKLLLQIIIAIVAFGQGVQVEAFANPSSEREWHLGAWSGVVTVIWLVGLTNLIDLTRRVEGLTAGIGMLLLILRAVTGFGSGAEFSALFSIGLAGALCGFLIYNLPPARIRLGGAGAGFVGFLVASLTTVNSSPDSTLSASMFVAVLILPLLGLLWIDSRPTDKGPPLAPLDPKHVRRRLAGADETETRGRSW